MTPEDLGATLRSEREKRHLSIEDVADQLKINPRLLLALEAGDAQALPHPAYARGFIRSYARLLGIGNDEIQEWFNDLKPGEPKKAPKPAPVQTEDLVLAQPEQRRGGAGKIILSLLILGAIAGAGYWAWQSGKLPFLEFKKTERVARTLPAPLPVEPEAPRPLPEPEIRSEPPMPAPVPAVPAAEAVAPGKQEPAPVAREDAPEQHKLVIIATEECWVHSNADKTDTRQFSLRKGDTFALTFAKNLELKLGNAGGVRLRYDGNELPPPGTSGQVKTITFPPRDS